MAEKHAQSIRSQTQARSRWIVVAAVAGLLAIGGWLLLAPGEIQKLQGAVAVPLTNEANPVSRLPPAPTAGHPAPDFSLATVAGDEIRLSDLRGQPVILNFWASWCGPCRVEMPELQAAHASQSKGGVAVIGVNLSKREGNMDDVPAFIKEFGVTFPVLLDVDGDVARLYQVRGQPASVFIDREGTVQTVWYGPVNEAFITERIDELVNS